MDQKGHGVLYKQCFSGNDFQSQYEEECPVNYSLKYSETESCKVNKPENPNPADYAETDLDQPTDFSLKYGESSDEDIKPTSFNYYVDNKTKSSDCYNRQPEEVSSEHATGNYSCEDQTPLMFSRCSSLSSLSGFEHITQSIPDDRSSVVSDSSRTTSGMISPSELPDSPTQTAPSSPKTNKQICFPVSEDLRQKKSVFEDDVATYKQEDTPIEFSRATSLSSLNIDNPNKAEFNLKTNSTASSVAGGDETKNKEVANLDSIQGHSSELKEENVTEKTETSYQETKIESTEAVDKILIDGISNIRIEQSRNDLSLNETSVNVKPSTAPERLPSISPKAEFSVKSNIPPIFSNPAYEASDDDVHTYHTEGTPANISHAGSHSDLNTLSMISGILPSGTENNSDEDSFCSESEESLLPKCNQPELFDEKIIQEKVGNTVDIPINKGLTIDLKEASTTASKQVYFNSESRLDYLEDKNRAHSFKEEVLSVSSNSRSNYNVCFNYSDPLSIKPATCANRYPTCKDHSVEKISSLESVLRLSPNPLIPEHHGNEKETLKGRDGFVLEQTSEKRKNCNIKESLCNDNVFSYKPNLKPVKNMQEQLGCSKTEPRSSLGVENWCNESCTPLEEVLVEQCIRLGMPNKNHRKNLEGRSFKSVDGRAIENWHTKTCTPFEEALVEQCIRLGMPQKNKKPEKNNSIPLNEKKIFKEREQRNGIQTKPITSKFSYSENRFVPLINRNPCHESGGNPQLFPNNSVNVPRRTQSPLHTLNAESWLGGSCTPLEEALVEQCIRLGMPRKNNSKNLESNNIKMPATAHDDFDKGISMSSHLSRSRIVPDTEKERNSSKKQERFVCNSGRRHTSKRKKPKESCKRCKKCRDKSKADHVKS